MTSEAKETEHEENNEDDNSMNSKEKEAKQDEFCLGLFRDKSLKKTFYFSARDSIYFNKFIFFLHDFISISDIFKIKIKF